MSMKEVNIESYIDCCEFVKLSHLYENMLHEGKNIKEALNFFLETGNLEQMNIYENVYEDNESVKIFSQFKKEVVFGFNIENIPNVLMGFLVNKIVAIGEYRCSDIVNIVSRIKKLEKGIGKIYSLYTVVTFLLGKENGMKKIAMMLYPELLELSESNRGIYFLLKSLIEAKRINVWWLDGNNAALYLTKPKVAVCFYGAIRGVDWQERLSENVKLICKPLMADSFLFSWNQCFVWPGFFRLSSQSWINRFLSAEMRDAPQEILEIYRGTNIFSNVYNILKNEMCIPVSNEEILKAGIGYVQTMDLNCFLASSEYMEIVRKLSHISKKRGYILRNFVILLFIRYKVFAYMSQVSKELNKNYDYIICCRHDIKYGNINISFAELAKLQFNEVGDRILGDAMSTHFVYGKFRAMEVYCDLFKSLVDFMLISGVKNITTGLIHGLSYNWLIFNGIVVKNNTTMIYRFNDINRFAIPDISEHLHRDIEKMRINNDFSEEKIASFQAWFDKFCLNYTNNEVFTNFKILDSKTKELESKNKILDSIQNNSNHKTLDSNPQILESLNAILLDNNIHSLDSKQLYFILQHSTAKQRIHNHLSYKLGKAMIENSKSILGYIRMPYVLSYIKDKHKQEQQQYQEAIKKNPNLKLPTLESYPDYKESLKEKECITYKLGEAFIKASKTWYKGGYVKLWFEVRKLKKEFEK